MPTQLLMRADGGKSIGMGHLHRACLVADMTKERFGFDSLVVIKKDKTSERFLEKRHVKFSTIDVTLSASEEVGHVRDIVVREKPVLLAFDILCDDLYSSYARMSKEVNCFSLAILDSPFAKEIDADIVVNGNPCFAKRKDSHQEKKYLFGPKYFLMDPVYAQVKAQESSPKVNKVLLTMGGTDHHDLLFRLLEAFETIKHSLTLLIVVSEASGYIDRLRSYLGKNSLIYELTIDVPCLAPLWGQCDVAITAGGNTLFERIAAGRPGATLCQLERQMQIANCFEELGVNVNLGFGPEIDSCLLQDRLDRFLHDAQEHLKQLSKAPGIIDGKGLLRLGDKIETLFQRGQNGL